jgi:DNA-binding MarR family transcriptional regulator
LKTGIEVAVFAALTTAVDDQCISRITQDQIAKLIGTSRRRVGQTLQDLESKGLVKTASPDVLRAVRLRRLPRPTAPFAQIPRVFLLGERLPVGDGEKRANVRWSHLLVLVRALVSTPDEDGWRNMNLQGLSRKISGKGTAHLELLGVDIDRPTRMLRMPTKPLENRACSTHQARSPERVSAVPASIIRGPAWEHLYEQEITYMGKPLGSRLPRSNGSLSVVTEEEFNIDLGSAPKVKGGRGEIVRMDQLSLPFASVDADV